MLDPHNISLLDFSLTGSCSDFNAVVAAPRRLLAELVQLAQAVAHEYPGADLVGGYQSGTGAVQQVLGVKLGGAGDAVNFRSQLVDFLLDLGTVLGSVGTVGGLYCQFPHSLQDSVGFVQCAFSRLNEGYAVLGVAAGLVQTSDLGAHFFGDGQSGSVVGSAVDAQSGGQFLQSLGHSLVVEYQLVIGV